MNCSPEIRCCLCESLCDSESDLETHIFNQHPQIFDESSPKKRIKSSHTSSSKRLRQAEGDDELEEIVLDGVPGEEFQIFLFCFDCQWNQNNII